MSNIDLGDLVEDAPLDVALGAKRAVYLDIPKLVESRALITGNSGAGKSRLARRLVEQAFGKVQIIVLDPEGEFSTLREKHDFLLAGHGGEMPAEPRAAALMAKRLYELRASAVLDLYDLRIDQQREFVRLFLESLLHLPRTEYRPMLVVLDEAQRFAPERGAGEASSLEAVQTLMTQGRKRGLCGIPATQRLSMLDKTCAAQANNVFIGRTTLDVDQKRAAAVLGITSQAERVALRDLPLGVFLAYGPAFNRTGVIRFKGGEVLTTHPKAGQRHAAAPPPTPDAIRKVAAELQDLPAQAEEEIRTLQAAKARVRELEREVREAKKAQPPPPPAPKAPKTRDVPVLKDAQIKRLEAAIARSGDSRVKFLEAQHAATVKLHAQEERVAGEMRSVLAALAAAREGPKGPVVGAGRSTGDVATAAPARPAPVVSPGGHFLLSEDPTVYRVPRDGAVRREPANGDSPATTRMGRAMLTLLAQRRRPFSKGQILTLTGYASSGPVSSMFAALLKHGLIGQDPYSGKLVILPAGVDALGDFTPLPTGKALREHLLRTAGPMERKFLEALFAAHPESVTKGAILEATGYASSGPVSSTFAKLVTMGYVVSTGPSLLRASDELFEE